MSGSSHASNLSDFFSYFLPSPAGESSLLRALMFILGLYRQYRKVSFFLKSVTVILPAKSLDRAVIYLQDPGINMFDGRRGVFHLSTVTEFCNRIQVIEDIMS